MYSTTGEHKIVAKDHIKQLINEEVERTSNKNENHVMLITCKQINFNKMSVERARCHGA